MRFIYFFIFVLILFLIIFALINLMIKYLNEPRSLQNDIESGQLSTLEKKSFFEKMKDLKISIKEYFDKELIRYEEANQKLKENYFDFIIDVRSKKEWEKGHYPTAIHIPIEPKDKFINNIDYYNRRLKYFVYCRTGERAKIAADIMKNMGFENVRYLKGNHIKLKLYN
jgi:rhodanese-related sulfurtransferase